MLETGTFRRSLPREYFLCVNRLIAKSVTTSIFKLFIIANLADRVEYISFISLSRNFIEINTGVLRGWWRSSYTLLVEMQIVMHFKEIGLAICVKSLFKMHIFVLVIWFLKIYLKEKTKSLHDDLIMKTFTLALCIKTQMSNNIKLSYVRVLSTGISQPWHYWHFEPDYSFLCCLVHCRMFNTIPGPYLKG